MPAVIDRRANERIRHALFGSTPAVVAELEPPTASVSRRRDRGDARTSSRRGGRREIALRQVAAARAARRVVCPRARPNRSSGWPATAPHLAPALVLGVGAAFDFHAGTKARAPLWMQSLGVEWLDRLDGSRRLGRRYVVTNAQFARSGPPERFIPLRQENRSLPWLKRPPVTSSMVWRFSLAGALSLAAGAPRRRPSDCGRFCRRCCCSLASPPRCCASQRRRGPDHGGRHQQASTSRTRRCRTRRVPTLAHGRDRSAL